MIRIAQAFRGQAPRVASHALPDNASTDATNARLLTGDITAWKQFTFTYELANYPVVETIYRLNGAWLSWDVDVDVARGIIPGDTTFRTYLTGLDAPRFTNYAMATSGAQPYPTTTRLLGVPAPNSVPTLVIGTDPTPTTFSVDITDPCDDLATNWVLSPGQSPTSQVVQDGAHGNPAPSFLIQTQNNTGVPAYAYRDFGTKSASVTTATWDANILDVGGNDSGSFCALFGCDGAGSGARIQVRGQLGSNIFIGVTAGSSFASGNGAMLSEVAGTGGLATGIWYTVQVTKTAHQGGTATIAAKLYVGGVGGTLLASVTTTNTFTDGGLFGPIDARGDDLLSVNFDNFHIQASGSLNNVITNLATSYVYTFVNDLGEESAPSLPSATITRPDGVSVTVTTPTGLPTGVSTDYGITTKRIYRAATGSTGTAFLFVAEIPLNTADYVDTLTDAELGEVLPSDIWALPPSDLRGILALPNGVMVGFRRNQVCFSAQNHPHAWPVEYRLNTDTDIVGIGNVDNTVVIGTKSFVYIASGNDPAAYSMSKFEVPYAAMSKRSFAYLTGIGVVFAGTNGLMAVSGPGQVRNLTDPVFTDEQWKALAPASMRAVAHNDIYFLFWETNSAKGCYAIDMKATGFGVVPMSFHASAMYNDPVGDVMFLVLDYDTEPDDPSLPIPPSSPHYIEGTHIYEFEGSSTEHMTYRWKSKLWLLEHPARMLMAQVRAESYENILFRVYADGVEVDEVVITEETEFTLTSVDEYTTLQLEVIGTSTVRVMQVSEDVSEFQ